MPTTESIVHGIQALTSDARILLATRFLRMFGYGLISVVLVLYLSAMQLSDPEIGTLISLTLLGDTIVSLSIATRADRVGRRRMLMIGSVLMTLGGGAFAATESFSVLLIAATLAVISPTGGEVGPFLSIEQAALSHIVGPSRRTTIFAWYNLVGSIATALGALLGGVSVAAAKQWGLLSADAYRPALLFYAVIGVILGIAFTFLSPSIEVTSGNPDTPTRERTVLGLHRSRGIVLRLSALFALDAFGGGFVMQSLLAYWLHVRFGIDAAALGGVFMGANLLAGVSSLAAGWLAQRVGLLNTMVFTHLPSNVLLILIPLMPSAGWAVTLLLIRFSISQMDVPTRQAYTMAVVSADERSAAAGVTTVARSLGAAISPAIATRLMATPTLMSIPLFLAGGIKIIYDLLLWRAFAARTPDPE